MSKLQKEIAEAVSHFKPTKAIFSVNSNWNGGISLSKIGVPTSDRDDVVTQLLVSRGRVREQFDPSIQKMVVSIHDYDLHTIVGDIQWEMLRFIGNFIRDKQDVKNSKLTTLYRWYNNKLSAQHLKDYANLEDNLWEVFKWLQGQRHLSKTNTTTIAALNLLDKIRERYETKGLKL